MHPGLIVKFHKVPADLHTQGGDDEIEVLLLLLHALLASDAQQVLLPSYDQLLSCEAELVDVELIPLEELRHDVEVSLSVVEIPKALEVVLEGKGLVQPCEGEWLAHRWRDVSG